MRLKDPFAAAKARFREDQKAGQTAGSQLAGDV
jgi:hypothetical protein